MFELLKSLFKARIDAIFVLGGTVMILLGIFEWHNQTNNIIYRAHPNGLIVFIGVFELLIGLFFVILFTYLSHKSNLKQKPNEYSLYSVTSVSKIPIESAPSVADQELKLVDSYRKLSFTQKKIIEFIYEYSLDQITLEDLFTNFQRWQVDKVQNPSEMYYRIKDLVNKEFLLLHKKGKKIAVVERKDSVRSTFAKNDIYFS